MAHSKKFTGILYEAGITTNYSNLISLFFLLNLGPGSVQRIKQEAVA